MSGLLTYRNYRAWPGRLYIASQPRPVTIPARLANVFISPLRLRVCLHNAESHYDVRDFALCRQTLNLRGEINTFASRAGIVTGRGCDAIYNRPGQAR